jgi:hypothetical protein
MPQPGGNSRPQVDWWWDGSDRGYFWTWLVALAGLVVLFSLGALLTGGTTPIRSVALANVVTGLGVVLLPTLIALRRLDRRQRLGEFGVLGDREVRRALHRTLTTLGLLDEERPLEARRRRRLPPVRPASWYKKLAACWAAFVLLDVTALWVTTGGLFASRDTGTDQFRAALDVIALPVLLAWLVVGLVALRKAARVARWLAARVESEEPGRAAAAPSRPLGRRLAADGRRAADVTLARWRGLENSGSRR